ncbi:MAG TPA: DEAD/DEAH box helicase [Methanocorpusculum sp.]|nr:DEAD/DEAH box helicase [Methanocorpusculum sp.]
MAESIVCTKTYEARDAVYKIPSMPIPKNISSYLEDRKIKLYSHQADSYDLAESGKNLIITTPTASGKTLCYALSVFKKLTENKDASALFIYPTKALTRDQLLYLKDLDKNFKTHTKPAVYDGDTAPSQRSKIREESRIILTNMYELHRILPWRNKWGDFFSNLSYVVIDEAHRYRGVFGSNTALLIRRLRRICNYYDSDPQFILSSATLCRAEEFAETLCGVKFTEIKNDGSPKSKRTFRIYYNAEKSSISSAAEIVNESIKSGRQTLCFTKSRIGAEITAVKCRGDGQSQNVVSYRGGYRPNERRKIELNLKHGNAAGVISTNALEVGIDVGTLDSVVISGFPGSMISVMQQAGRAGRNGQDSLITFVAGNSPIDKFYAKNPEAFFNARAEQAILGIENPYILSSHLLCAAAEIPYSHTRDRKYFGDSAADIIKELNDKKLVASTSRGYVCCGKDSPAQKNSYFGLFGKTWRVMYGKSTLETMDDCQAYREGFPGAVIIHQGERYRVSINDSDNKIIHVVKIKEEYSTRPISSTEISVISADKITDHKNIRVYYGSVIVSNQILGYSVIEYDKIISANELTLPPKTFETKACWITFDDDAPLTPENIAGSLHGTEHALVAAMPLYVLSDRSDIGGVSAPMHCDTAAPTIFIYDGVEGGIGLAEKASEIFPQIISAAEKIVSECECENGCPACIQSPKCGNNNQCLDKKGTKMLLSYLKKESV